MAEPPTSRRERRWSRPRPRRDWRWYLGTVGRVLIATGLLMFGFVAYQLWGTGIQYAQAQDELDDEFAELLAATTTAAPTTVATTVPTTTTPATSASSVPSTTAPTTTVPPTTVPPTTVPPPPPIEEGDAIAKIEAPAIGLDAIVVAGVSVEDLQKGPGHYPFTPLPGQLGNAAIAGHRTTYGQPFYRVDELQPRDRIVVTTVAGRFVYRVTGTQIVSPSDSHVITTVDPEVATLTLTSCHPRYTARERIIVSAELDLDASPAPGPATPNYGRDDVAPPPSTLPGGPTVTATAPSTSATPITVGEPATTLTSAATTTAPATTVPAPPTTTTAGGGEGADGVGDAFEQGWFDDDAAWAQVAWWGLALTAISIGSYLLSRATRTNWVGGLVGVVPFVVCLYFFFENVNRLLPAAL